jgi:predicted RNase H-like HicB family nuclease
MAERVFRAIYRRGEEYILASTPDLPGAFGQGRTIDEARDDLKAAILLMLEDVEESAREDAVEAILQEELVVSTA